jgi:outer membrane protein assembly factor BamB
MMQFTKFMVFLALFSLAVPFTACSAPPATSEPEMPKASVEASASGHDWPQWRGPLQDGISRETGLLALWPAEGPTELWRVKLGKGYSSFAVVGERVYTMVGDDTGEYVVCMSAMDGSILWKTRSGDLFLNTYGDGPRATPTVHEGRVYAAGAIGSILCLDAETGATVWDLNTVKEFGGESLEWGFSASPIILDEKLIIVANSQSNNSLVALDKETGKPIWTSLNDRGGYSTPLKIELSGKPHIVVVTAEAVVGVEAAGGGELWRYAWETTMDANVATPIFHNNHLFISSGYDTGGALFEVSETEMKVVWKSKKIKNNFSSSILIDGHLYGFHNTILTCLNFDTGEVKWSQRGFYKGSLLSADGKLIIFGERGNLALAETSPEAYTEISTTTVFQGAKNWVVPALSGGRLFLRNAEEVVCLSLRP